MLQDYAIRIWRVAAAGERLVGRSRLRDGRETAGLPDKVGTQTPRKTRHYKDLRQRRHELAGGEGAEAGGEFGGGQAALAVEAAEKIGDGGFPFLRVAFHAAGDQVAVGIAPRPPFRQRGFRQIPFSENAFPQTDSFFYCRSYP